MNNRILDLIEHLICYRGSVLDFIYNKYEYIIIIQDSWRRYPTLKEQQIHYFQYLPLTHRLTTPIGYICQISDIYVRLIEFKMKNEIDKMLFDTPEFSNRVKYHWSEKNTNFQHELSLIKQSEWPSIDFPEEILFNGTVNKNHPFIRDFVGERAFENTLYKYNFKTEAQIVDFLLKMRN